MDIFENRDEIRQENPAVTPAAPAGEVSTPAPEPASYFRAAADLGMTIDPRRTPAVGETAAEVRQPEPPETPAGMKQDVPAAAPVNTPVPPKPEVPRAAPGEAPAYPRPEAPRWEPPVYSKPAAPNPPQPEAPKPMPERKRKGGFWKKAVAGVLVLALVAAGCAFTADVMNQRWENKYQQMSSVYSQQMLQLQKQIDENAKANENTGESVSGSPVVSAGDGLTPSQVYARNVDAVVAISCTIRQGYSSGTSMGSGFIMTEDGYVTTNYHVVDGASKIDIITHDGTSYAAELVGYDETNDVAVLKMEAEGLPYVTIGSSDDLIVGDQVVAIGNPLGELTNTLTAGYISAKERDVTTDSVTINMLQTDAAINSGNSGGPLFNMRGEVVGITTAKYSGESSSGATIEGIGFAIPIDDVYDLIEDLITHGYVTGAYLGVMVSEMNAESAEYYGLPVGAYVQEVTPGYCAEEAGIQAKDIIVALGTHEVRGLNDLTRALRGFEAGDTTTITVYRGGEELVLTITLDERPQEEPVPVGSGEMPEDGSYEEWYEYFQPFFDDDD